MPRLIDEIRTQGVRMPWWVAPHREAEWIEHQKRVLALLHDPKLPVILCDNVAYYYYHGTDQEHWDLERDFPNVAPPFDQFWGEYSIYSEIRSAEKGTHDMRSLGLGKHARCGILITAVDPKDAKGEGIRAECHWILWCEVFIDYDVHGERPDGVPGPIFLQVDKEGRVLDAPWMQSFCEERDQEVMKSLFTWLHPALLAVSFMHCKNVTITDNAVPKPLAKKFHTKTGHWPTQYKTLIIEPLKAILRSEGGSDKHGLQKAIHICRGHFRDYREGKGLFGKYHVLTWTPMTVRGTKGKDAPPREIEVKI